MRKKILANKSYFHRLVYSYCAIIIVLFVIYFATYSIIASAFEREHKDSINQMLENARDNIDSQIISLNQLANMIASNEEMMQNFEGGAGNGFVFDDYRCVHFLKDSISTNKYVEEIYVYVKNRDRIISSSTSSNSMDYFDSKHRTDDYLYNDWKKFIDGNFSRKLAMLPKRINSNGIIDKYFAYAVSLPMDVSYEKPLTLVVLVDQNKFTRYIGKDGFEDGQFSIIDKDGDLLVSIGSVMKGSELSNLSSSDIKVKGEKYSVSTIKSNITSWKYIVITPKKTYMNQVQMVKGIAFACMIAYIIIGILMLHFFTRKNYAPLEGLFKLLNIKRIENENEFSQIKQNIESLQTEYTKLLKANRAFTQINRKRYFKNILEGSGNSKDLFSDENMARFDFKIVDDSFVVVLIKIQNSSDFLELMDMKLELAQYALTNVVEELFDQNNTRAYSTPISGDTLGLIINFGDSSYAVKNILIDVLYSVIEFFFENYGMNLFISVSGEVESLYELENCYLEAKQAMEYRSVLKDTKLVFYDEVFEKRMDYSFSTEHKRDLISAINRGDFDKAKGIIDELFDINVYSGEFAVDAIKVFIFEIERTLLNIVPMALAINMTEFEDKNVDEIHDRLIKSIFEYCTIQKSKSQVDLGEVVSKYIDENYADPDLSVNTLGEKFVLSPSYLSKLFKEQTGESLLSYIHSVRIKKAEEYLVSGMNIDAVAQKVGYVSTSSFTRVFKKIHGVTPGHYRRDKQRD